jgi:putative addiction module killer protein
MLDVQTRVRIDRVVERFVDGNLGDHKSVGAGVLETRINFGPGYRIYYGARRRHDTHIARRLLKT